MATDRQFTFGSFRFDPRTGQLWRGDGEVKLTPRAAAVLHILAERAQQLVTREELFDEAWGGVVVTDDALTTCIRELRQALGDNARRPRYIETRHRRGYRLMVPAAKAPDRSHATAMRLASPPSTTLVGRVEEIDVLRRRLESALAGRRQVVFVTGEPGIGKSALVDTFTDQLADNGFRVAHGQCVDHHGIGEPYLPLVELLMRLVTGSNGARIKAILSSHAPSWLAQMPSLWSKSERSVLEARGRATRDRMLSELTSAIEAIAADTPLVLQLEDIHWSDASTLDWLAHVARRPEPARLMLLATYRPADAAAIAAGLGRITAELALHGHCHEVSLRPLTRDAIETYLTAKLGNSNPFVQRREIAQLLLERTGGNPLFMVGIVNQLSNQDAAVTAGAIGMIPPDVRRFIERQIDELDANDCDLLTAATVIGREFATAAVAAALDIGVEQVEAACARLARQGVFIVGAGMIGWPDGTQTERHAFRHDLYRELLYARLPATRRATAHARVGRRLESAWGSCLDAIAAELAEHFERAHEHARAIPHHQRAAAKALRRSANEEAIGHLRRALDAIGYITDESERTRTEVELRVGLGAAYMASRGFGAPEVLEAYSRAELLCERLGERVDLFPAIWGQWLFRAGRSEMEAARRLCTRLINLAEKFDDTGLKLQAHHANWATSFVSGELAKARAHAQSGLALFDARIHQPMASSYGNHDAACCACNFSAMSLALAGDDAGARAMTEQSVAAARSLNDPFTLALTLFFTSATTQMLGDVPLATVNSELSIQIATEHGLAQPKAWSLGVAGWCAAENGDVDRGVALATQAIATMQAIQSRHFLPYLFALLASAHLKAGQYSDAMKAVEDGLAMAEATSEHFYSAELHRLHGELLVRSPYGQKRKAEASFHAAIRVATKLGATALGHKASESLRRWCR